MCDYTETFLYRPGVQGGLSVRKGYQFLYMSYCDQGSGFLAGSWWWVQR